jgi:hypothetical protein
MKIIAKSGPRAYILEATSDEIDKLAGRLTCKDNYGQENDPLYILGTKFNIINAFTQIYRNGQRKREIEIVRKTLEGVINSLDIIEPFIEEPKVEPPAEVQP